MAISIFYLGPKGTYSEQAAYAYAQSFNKRRKKVYLQSYSSIPKVLKATAKCEDSICVVPVENSIGGSVSVTLDTLWELDNLKIQNAFSLPINHAFLSQSVDFQTIKIVYSHSQAIAQCQRWIDKHIPHATLIPTSSTTEALSCLKIDDTAGAIASIWAAQMYGLSVLAHPINDYENNHTRFWVLCSKPAKKVGNCLSLAFKLPDNVSGALLTPLRLLDQKNINMSHIESRPTKRLLGEYLFFIDLDADPTSKQVQIALDELEGCTEVLKIFGSYMSYNIIDMKDNFCFTQKIPDNLSEPFLYDTEWAEV